MSGVGVTSFPLTSGLMNFMMHDRHTGPAWNVLMWTMLFLGQGIQVSLYCQEWYARRHCPLPQVRDHDRHSAPHLEGHTSPPQQPALYCSPIQQSFGQGPGPGVGASVSWMCRVGTGELTYNSPLSGTDDLLGAGDTSILVLPYLEIRAPSLPR